MAWLIALITLLPIIIMQVAMPYFVKRTIVFGVTIPELFRKDAKLKLFKRQYVTFSLIVSIVSIVFFIFWGISTEPADELLIIISVILQFIIIFVSFVLYFYFHKKTKNYKNEMKWTEQLKEVAVVDLSIRSEENMPSWYIYLIPMVVVVGVIGYTFLQYDSFPQEIPIHWGVDGKPDAFTKKTPFSVIQLLLILLILQIMMLFINIAIKNAGIKLSATNLEASKKRQTMTRKYTSWFLFYTTVLMTVLFVFLHLEMIYAGLFHEYFSLFLLVGFIFAVMFGVIVLYVKIGNSDKGIDVFVSDGIMDKDEDQYWKGGMFYFNKNDPSILVEQRNGIGYTINMANPKAYLLLIVPIVLILIIAFIS